MEFLIYFLILTLAILLTIQITKNYVKDSKVQINKAYEEQISKLSVENQFLKEREVDPSKNMSVETHISVVADLKDAIKSHEMTIAAQTMDLRELLEKHKKVVSQKKSGEVRLGLTAEQFMPLFDEFPYDKQKCKFLGSPLDMIYFGEDEIVFIEFKSGNSRLSTKQNKLRQAIIRGNIRFETHRLNENGYTRE